MVRVCVREVMRVLLNTGKYLPQCGHIEAAARLRVRTVVRQNQHGADRGKQGEYLRAGR